MKLRSGWLFLLALSLLAGTVLGGCGAAGEPGGEAVNMTVGEEPLSYSLSQAVPEPVAPDARGSIRLAVGEPLVASISVGQVHRFALPEDGAAEERFVVALIDQRGIDLVLSLEDERDGVLASVDSFNVDQGIEQLEALTPSGANLFLVVQSHGQKTGSGSYRVELLDWRRPTSRIRRLVAALPEIWSGLKDCYERREPRFLSQCVATAQLAEELSYSHGAGWAYYLMALGANETSSLPVSLALLELARHRWREARYVVERNMVLALEAESYNRRGQQDRALRLYRKVVDFWCSRKALPEIAEGTNRLGQIRLDRREFAVAIECFVEAEKLYDQVGFEVEAAHPIFNRGVAEFFLGNLPASLALYEEVERRLRGHEESNRRTLLDLLIGLTLQYRRRGELWRMAATSERALSLIEKIDDPGRKGALVQNRASYFVAVGDKRAALGEYRRALEFFHQSADRRLEAFTLSNLAHLRGEQGEPDEAFDLLEQALRIAREAQDEQNIALAKRWRGTLRWQQGDMDAALVDLSEALQAERIAGSRLRQVGILNTLAELHLDAGRAESSRALLDEALELNGGIDPNLEADSRYVLSRVLREQGELETALAQIERVLTIDGELRAGLAGAEARDAFLEDRRDRFETKIDLLLRLDAQSSSTSLAQRAFQTSESARARSLSELLAEADVELRLAFSPMLLSQQERLDQEISSAQADLRDLKSLSNDQDDEVKALALRIDSLRDERSRLEWKIRQASPRYADLTYPQPATVKQTQELLAPKTALLEYVISDDGCYLFVVGRDQFSVVGLTISAATVGQTVEELRQGLKGTGQFQTRKYQRAARTLYEALIAPASELLVDVERLVVIPDRELYYVPFEALLTEKATASIENVSRWPYLMRRFEIGYSPSATVLSTLRRSRAAATDRLVVFADPVYSGDLRRLTASGREAREIEQLFPDSRKVTLFLREKASETRVKTSSELRLARWVHFATHGSIDEQDAGNTRLELSRDGSPNGEDGALRLREIFDLDLSAELVVLSACQTALGREVTGEGLVGLSRGFFYAGARSLVMSQWRVEDEQTADLMVRFYRSLLANDDPIAALAQAKRGAVESATIGSHPHFWAPFVLVGNPARGEL